MQTIEKTKHIETNEMEDENFYSEPKKEERIYQMMDMIRKRISMYKYDLDSAKVESYDAKQDNELHWTIKVEKDAKVQMILGKISALEKLLKDFEEMQSSMSLV